MPLILSGNVATATAATGYDVANSVRYNDGDSPRLHRTLGTATDVDKWTFSCWFKRSTLSATQYLFYGYASGEESAIVLKSDDTIDWYNYFSSSEQGQLVTNRKFRDVGAWYHIVCAYDSDNGTAGNRMRMYINGTEETSFATDTNPASDENSTINKAVLHNIGMKYSDSGSGYFDGYLAEVCFVDGQQLAPTSFGEFDEDSPRIWKPKDVSGLTFGTNGFYLDFEDSSNLGNDANGGTDWTETNLAATDQTTDTCTNNFATLNPLDNAQSDATYSEGNCKWATTTNSHVFWGRSTIGVSSGKWYAEFKATSIAEHSYVGICNNEPEDNSTVLAGGGGAATTTGAYEWGYKTSDGQIYNTDGGSSYGDTYGDGAIIGVLLNLDDNEISFSKDGVVQNSGTAVSITAAASTPHGNYFLCVADGTSGTSGTFEANFGNPSFSISSGNADANGYGNFEYAPPSGYYSLCTKNLAEYG